MCQGFRAHPYPARRSAASYLAELICKLARRSAHIGRVGYLPFFLTLSTRQRRPLVAVSIKPLAPLLITNPGRGTEGSMVSSNVPGTNCLDDDFAGLGHSHFTSDITCDIDFDSVSTKPRRGLL